MIQKVYIARHGFRLNWVDSKWKSATGLPRDPPLAAYGETQATELANWFMNLPAHERPTAIFSSPYYRCLQTARPTSRALQVPIYVEHGISEWYSPAAPGTGLHPRPFPASELKQYFSEIDPSWSSVWYPSRKGESVFEILDRVEGTLNILVPEIEQRFGDKHTHILMVGHAATVIALARGLLGDRSLSLRVGCCSLTEIVRKADSSNVIGGWEAKLLASGHHLAQGASRDWGFEDIEVSNGKVVDDVGMAGTEDEVDDTSGPQTQKSSL
ncbi:phosphoglycerate mutase-like protein [Coniophora puteana RWD-64-598 SS2]|uniref:Phosphoglycerate mutase-like protein n=1 Tax=Coniophora puteana (strain RWD-64-598) TaxID=741705 RepID=A0A5M3N5R7_CONPW|nr:phosphoglycerate mutase-like protein [Coniophora puteana RWD-64-598 SS2]EIW86668.1 phosphoglycerate mutase-like protein [Coniophora puteana RWD-64-598 SS2]